jgi:hypothetical protein
MLYDAIRGQNIKATKAKNMLGGKDRHAPYQEGMID